MQTPHILSVSKLVNKLTSSAVRETEPSVMATPQG